MFLLSFKRSQASCRVEAWVSGFLSPLPSSGRGTLAFLEVQHESQTSVCVVRDTRDSH